MEAGWDAEGRCWILACVVLLHKVLSGCHCSRGPAIAACGVLRGGQGYKDNPSSQKWKASMESPLKYSLSECAGLDQIIGMAM